MDEIRKALERARELLEEARTWRLDDEPLECYFCTQRAHALIVSARFRLRTLRSTPA